MRIPDAYRSAEDLERELGDPFDPASGPLSFERALELDERGAYPREAVARLAELRFPHFFVPAALGGRLDSIEEVFPAVRAVARRDLTLAIALGQTFVGALPVWIAGTDAQKRRLAEIMLAGGQGAIALTEEAHGSDILANELRAERTPGGFRLSGEKWLINNGTLGAFLSVFARLAGEDAAAGRDFSLFFVDKARLAPGAAEPLPRVATLGVRGMDVSGVRLCDAEVGTDALLGDAGSGPELTLKALQISRAGCAGFSLGAADTALRAALDFARSRRLYGDSVFAIPHARGALADAFVDLLICDCLVTATCRSMHVAPEQLSVRSAVVKYFVPTRVEDVIRSLSVVLGARHYLREGRFAIFQKMLRDNSVVSLFDGSTVINLNALLRQLGRLAEFRSERDADLAARLEQTCALARPLPPLGFTSLRLLSPGRDDAVQGLELARARLRAAPPPGVAPPLREPIEALAGDLADALQRHEVALREATAATGADAQRSPELFALAEDYCTLHAAATCLHVWLHNHDSLDSFFARGEWLALALSRLVVRLGASTRRLPGCRNAVADELARLHDQDRLFGLVPIQLAKRSGRTTDA